VQQFAKLYSKLVSVFLHLILSEEVKKIINEWTKDNVVYLVSAKLNPADRMSELCKESAQITEEMSRNWLNNYYFFGKRMRSLSQQQQEKNKKKKKANNNNKLSVYTCTYSNDRKK
jgi:hypothetical protein